MRVRRAIDMLAAYMNAFIDAGILVIGENGTVTVNIEGLTGPAGADGASADFGLTDADARMSRLENAVRFLGAEPNEFSPIDDFPSGD